MNIIHGHPLVFIWFGLLAEVEGVSEVSAWKEQINLSQPNVEGFFSTQLLGSGVVSHSFESRRYTDALK